MHPHYLTPLFKPRSVAVIGASDRENAVGAIVFSNLANGEYSGEVYPVNPKHPQVGGREAYPSILEVPKVVDLAVIATPAARVPEVIGQCGQRGVRGAVVLSAGFSEAGEAGRRLETELQTVARQHSVRILGPNCLGIMRPEIGLNATFGHQAASPGRLALASQSGALCAAILDWAATEEVGFSSIISTGAASDIGFGEILDFLVADAETDAILLYVEGMRDARRFMSALRAAARAKPVLVMKVGRHAEGSRAAFSHTGALVGADDVFDAALRRTGSVRVLHFSNLFAGAKTLSLGVRTAGRGLAIITNGGGPGVMAADYLADKGLALATLGEETLKRLDAVLPASWPHANPVDLIGDADAERYREAISICREDPAVHALLVILTPQAMTHPETVARAVLTLASGSDKPVLTCWMGEESVASSRTLFREAAIPTYRTPEAAVEAFALLAAHRENQRALLQMPPPIERESNPDIEGARMIIEAVLAEGRDVLGPVEAKALLAAFRIPITRGTLARTPADALLIAEEIGFPVVIKVSSPSISHKSDVGGVRLRIGDARTLRREVTDMLRRVAEQRPDARIDGVVVEPMVEQANRRELMIGVVSDPVFGPVISFGVGGTLVEIIADRAIGFPPLNGFLARDLIARTRAARLLGAFRQLPPVRLESVVDVLLRVSEMVCELPLITEMDINPLIVDEAGATVMDARVRVARRPPSEPEYGHMAIHPYPTKLERRSLLPDGSELVIRPIRPEDAQIESRFVRELSERSRHFRFMYALRELTPEMLSRFTQIDYDREMALVAITPIDGAERQIGVSRYVINPDGRSCEMAIIVADEWQGKGIATELMRNLIDIARVRRLELMEGVVLVENHGMLRLAERLGFDMLRADDDPALVRISKRL